MAIEQKTYGFARHPGHILQRELVARDMTQTDLAERADLSAKVISEILSGKAPISNETAIRLEYVLGIPAQTWNALQSNYNAALARDRERERVRQEIALAQKFPYAKIREIGGDLADTREPEERVEELKRFFGVATLSQVFKVDSAKHYLAAALRTNAGTLKKEPDQYALAAWFRVGELCAAKMNCAAYSEPELKQSLPKIREIIFRETISSAWMQIRLILAACGVKVMAIPYLPNTFVNGAVRWIGDNPVILINNRNAYADIFWFTLLHEICHILKHGKRYACVVYQGSADAPSRSAQEQEADLFAADFFISQEAFQRFAAEYRMSPCKATIMACAAEQQIPDYVLIGRLCHEHVMKWKDPCATSRPKVII